jgi:hypothetical protein
MIAITLLLCEPLLLALLLGASPKAKRIAPIIAMMALLLPWFLPGEWVVPRALAALAATLYFIRAIELSRHSEPMSFTKRLWCLTSTFDALGSRVVTPSIRAKEIIALVPWVLLSIFSWWTFVQTNETVRLWGLGLVAFYGTVEAMTRITEIAYRAAGIEIPPVQVQPILARSVSEFWGQRWNRPISTWLRQFCYLPFAKQRRPRVGMVSAFSASTAIHFYFIWTALGLRAGLIMAGFFLIQIPLLLIEQRFSIRQWPQGLARAWTICVLVAASPLFIDPMLSVFFTF